MSDETELKGAAKPTENESQKRENGGRRSLLAAVFANLAITVAKLVAFLFTGSTSMLAEAAHSLADTSKQVVLFIGRARAERHPDPDHPFGYGPERYFWAFLVAIVLYPLGAVYAMIQSVPKLTEPEAMADPSWAIGTLLVAMLFEGLSLRVAVKEARKINREDSLWRFIRRSRDPDIPAVLLEDASAVIGLGIALLAILLALVTGDPRFDAIGGILISLLLIAIAAVLSVEMKSLLIGESATRDDIALIRRAIMAHPQLRRLIYLRTLHLAPEELLVAAKVELTRDLTFSQVVETIDAMEKRVYECLPRVRVLHIEPDIYQPTERPEPSWHPQNARRNKDPAQES